MNEGMKLASHPAVSSLLQDPRFMRLVMQALAVPGKISELSEEQRAQLLRLLGAAPQREVDDLRRAVRSLEEEVTRLRAKA
jgi:ubiquinone biosynthesis protein UbiJ